MTVPDGFGRDFRDALFARTTSTAATRLAVVLLDDAYTQKSTVVEAGYRHLLDATRLQIATSSAHALSCSTPDCSRSRQRGKAARRVPVGR